MAIYAGKIPSFTWATKPSATSYVGEAFLSDVGQNGTLVYSNGARWIIPTVRLLYGGLPIGLPSSGIIGNNGALSGLTAFPIAIGPCYLYFPAGAISSGSAAGFYYTNVTSTTAGTIFNNTYTSGCPAIPASPTAFSTTGPGAYVQTTGTSIRSAEITLLGGLLGVNGGLRVRAIFAYNNSATIKSGAFYFGTTYFATTGSPTTTTGIDVEKIAFNAGIENKQILQRDTANIGVPSSAAVSAIAINTAVDQSLNIGLNLNALATDFIIVTNYLIEVIPS